MVNKSKMALVIKHKLNIKLNSIPGSTTYFIYFSLTIFHLSCNDLYPVELFCTMVIKHIENVNANIKINYDRQVHDEDYLIHTFSFVRYKIKRTILSKISYAFRNQHSLSATYKFRT